MKTIINKIRSIRIQKGYTQEYMSIQLGITQKTYRRLENGNGKIDFKRLQKISKILEIEFKMLIVPDAGSCEIETGNTKAKKSNSVSLLNDRINHLESEVVFLQHLLEKVFQNK